MAGLRTLREAGVQTGIWWYADYPTHYQGDASLADAATGDRIRTALAERIAAGARAIKADTSAVYRTSSTLVRRCRRSLCREHSHCLTVLWKAGFSAMTSTPDLDDLGGRGFDIFEWIVYFGS